MLLASFTITRPDQPRSAATCSREPTVRIGDVSRGAASVGVRTTGSTDGGTSCSSCTLPIATIERVASAAGNEAITSCSVGRPTP